MTYRVIQWATGNVGRAAIEGVRNHPDLELVGAYVYSDEKAGRDAGELAGLEPLGVEATNDINTVLGLDADCVVYAPMLANPTDVVRLLASGKNVVTPVGWVYPFRSHDLTAVEAACKEGQATLHGTGINPGGITEQLPLVLSAFCTNIKHVRAEEFSDIRTYGTTSVVRDIMLFGHTPESARKSPMLKILGGGFGQSLDMAGLHGQAGGRPFQGLHAGHLIDTDRALAGAGSLGSPLVDRAHVGDAAVPFRLLDGRREPIADPVGMQIERAEVASAHGPARSWTRSRGVALPPPARGHSSD